MAIRKRGILWKKRVCEKEIALAEERGVLTYSVKKQVFQQMAKQNIIEGSFIFIFVDTRSRTVREVEYVRMEGPLTKWSSRFAFIYAPIYPQIKLHKNKERLQECKFLDNPPTSVSSIYLPLDSIDFELSDHQKISFALVVDLKKAPSARNYHCQDLVAVNTKLAISDTVETNHPESTPSVTAEDDDNRLTDWLSRRMSSPRKPQENKPEAKTPANTRSKWKNSHFRKRGRSNPNSNKLDKRDPGNSKYSGPSGETVSAPATPLRDDNLSQAQDLPENYSDLMATFKSPHKPKTQIQPNNRCLGFDPETICTHSPPRKNVDTSPRSTPTPPASDYPSTKHNEQVLLDENQQLRNELAALKLQLQGGYSPQNKPVQNQVNPAQSLQPGPGPNFLTMGRPTGPPQRNVSYTLDDSRNSPRRQHPENPSLDSYTFSYENLFSQSPSVSRSASPENGLSIPHFECGGKPSSARSDILNPRSLPTTYVNRTARTPLIDFPCPPPTIDKYDKLAENFSSMSETPSSSSWMTCGATYNNSEHILSGHFSYEPLYQGFVGEGKR